MKRITRIMSVMLLCAFIGCGSASINPVQRPRHPQPAPTLTQVSETRLDPGGVSATSRQLTVGYSPPAPLPTTSSKPAIPPAAAKPLVGPANQTNAVRQQPERTSAPPQVAGSGKVLDVGLKASKPAAAAIPPTRILAAPPPSPAVWPSHADDTSLPDPGETDRRSIEALENGSGELVIKPVQPPPPRPVQQTGLR